MLKHTRIAAGMVCMPAAIILHTTLQAYRDKALLLFDQEARLGTRTPDFQAWYRAFRVNAVLPGAVRWDDGVDKASRLLADATFSFAGCFLPKITIWTAGSILCTALALAIWLWIAHRWGFAIALRVAGASPSAPRTRRAAAIQSLAILAVCLASVTGVWAACCVFPALFPLEPHTLIGPGAWAIIAPPAGWLAWIVGCRTLRGIGRWLRRCRQPFRRVQSSTTECLSCGYPRRGLDPGLRRPECGYPNDRSPPPRKWPKRVLLAATISGGGAFLLAALTFIFPLAGFQLLYLAAMGQRAVAALVVPVLEAAADSQDVMWPETDKPVLIQWSDATAVIQTRRLPPAAQSGTSRIAFAWAYASGNSSDPNAWTVKSGLAGSDKLPGSGFLELRLTRERVLWTTVLSGSPNTNRGHLHGLPVRFEVGDDNNALPEAVLRDINSRLESASPG